MTKDSKATRQYDMDLIAAERRWILEKKGCVVEAVSAIAGVPLEGSQRDIRAEQLRWIEGTDEEAFRSVVRFVERVGSQTETEAGKALSQMEMRARAITPAKIREETGSGAQVLVAIPPTDKHQGHGAKVTPAKGRGFVENDGDEQLFLKEGKPYRSLIFTKKTGK